VQQTKPAPTQTPAAAQIAASSTSNARSRVLSLKTLAIRASASSLWRYDSLADYPATIKAPIFAQLIKNAELSADNLKILLGSEQKKLDLSPASCASSTR
jgi:hypothetical protein